MNIFRKLFGKAEIEIPIFEDSPVVRAHIIFIGHVQGVGFRYNTYHAAQKLDLTGWVRNLSDGTVECEIQGQRNKIKYLIEHMKKLPMPDVENVLYSEIPIKDEIDFKMK